MDCERCREAVSAGLDGEAGCAEMRAVDAHLSGCAACARWVERAVAVTRHVRIRPVQEAPDLAAAVLEARERRCPPQVPVPAPVEPAADGAVSAPRGTGGCGCPPTCGCGCQQGSLCRCRHSVA